MTAIPMKSMDATNAEELLMFLTRECSTFVQSINKDITTLTPETLVNNLSLIQESLCHNTATAWAKKRWVSEGNKVWLDNGNTYNPHPVGYKNEALTYILDMVNNLFMGGYTFPNKHALKLVDFVKESNSLQMPLMASIVTLEGEGGDIGKPTILTRLGGCAVRCKGCDTPHSWNVKSSDDTSIIDLTSVTESEEYSRTLSVGEIANIIKAQARKFGIKRVSITGGEPLHYIKALRLLIADLYLEGYDINLETSGTIFDPVIFSMCHVSMDIKTPSSNVTLSETQIGALMGVASYYSNIDSQIKAVILSEEDLIFIVDNFPKLVTKRKGKQHKGVCLTPWADAVQDKLNVTHISNNINQITSWLLNNQERLNLDTSQFRVIAQQHKLCNFNEI